MCRSRDPRFRVPPECAFENFPLLLGILLRFPKGRPSPLFSQMEQISPWHAVDPFWSWEGQGSGFLLPPSRPPSAFFVSSVPEVLFFPRYLMAGLGSSSEDEGDSPSESGEEETPKLPRKVRRPDPAGRGCWESPGSAVQPQPPRFCPLLVVHSLTLPLTSPSPPSSAAPGQSQDPGSRTQLTPKTTNSKRHQSTLTRTPGQ